MAAKTPIKKPKRGTRRGLIQARVNVDEFREILTKAEVYAQGDLSKYVRLACLDYRPLKRVAK